MGGVGENCVKSQFWDKILKCFHLSAENHKMGLLIIFQGWWNFQKKRNLTPIQLGTWEHLHKLFADTVSVYNKLFANAVVANSKLFADTK